MIEYKENDIYTYNNKKYKLIKFIQPTFVLKTDKKTLNRIFNKNKTNQFYVYDSWLVQDMWGNEIVIDVKQPSSTRIEGGESSLHSWKEAPIDDTYEVNLLLDSYEEYFTGRNLNIVDKQLLQKRQELADFIKFLKNNVLLSLTNKQFTKDNIRTDEPYEKISKIACGWRILECQRSHPTFQGYKNFQMFIKDNPIVWEKMKKKIQKWKNEYKQQKKRNTEISTESMVEN